MNSEFENTIVKRFCFTAKCKFRYPGQCVRNFFVAFIDDVLKNGARKCQYFREKMIGTSI